MTDGWVERRTGLRPSVAPSAAGDRVGLDPAARPSAPEPDPSVTFPAQGLAVSAHLQDVHEHYRAELANVRGVVDQVRAGVASLADARSAVNEMAVRANNWTLGGVCQAHCLALTQHHTMESEAIFPHLVQQQPELAPVVARLHAEHLLIHEVLEDLDRALVHLVGQPGDLQPLDDALVVLGDTLLSHFAYEERELIAPIARHGFFAGQV